MGNLIVIMQRTTVIISHFSEWCFRLVQYQKKRLQQQLIEPLRLPVHSQDYQEHWGACVFLSPSDRGCPLHASHLITNNSDAVQPTQIRLTLSSCLNWPKYGYFPGVDDQGCSATLMKPETSSQSVTHFVFGVEKLLCWYFLTSK